MPIGYDRALRAHLDIFELDFVGVEKPLIELLKVSCIQLPNFFRVAMGVNLLSEAILALLLRLQESTNFCCPPKIMSNIYLKRKNIAPNRRRLTYKMLL